MPPPYKGASKGPAVAELQPGQTIQSIFLVQSKDVREKKTGEPYLSLILMDRTGELDAKMWDNVATVMDTFDRSDFVRVKGVTQLYQNRTQLTIHALTPVDGAEVDITEFLPASRRDPEEMMAELRGIIGSMNSEPLKALLESMFADPAVAQGFMRAPAAKSIHHAWLGGLLEHVLSLCALARPLARHYGNIDEDLLIAGCILHDIGKISELSYSRAFGYTTEGQLLGHMQIALRIVADHLPPGFPPKLRNLLEHLILSHHGQLEFGSPKVPLFPEALLLHHMDNMDSKMETMRASIEKDKSNSGEWTGYNYALERSVLDKDKYLAGSPPKPEPRQPASKPAPPARSGSLFGEALQSAYSNVKEKA
jgi:3'-5' exoribonuclease